MKPTVSTIAESSARHGSGPQAGELPYGALIENSPDMMWLLDAGGQIAFASPSSLRKLGHAREEIVGRNWLELVHPSDLPAVSREITALVCEPRGARTVEFRVCAKGGAGCWIEAAITNLLADPAVRALVVNSRDISDQKRAALERKVILEVIDNLSFRRNLHDILGQIQKSLQKAILADNYFVMLQDPRTQSLFLPFFSSQVDAPPSSEQIARSSAAYVFRTGRPMLITPTTLEELEASGEVVSVGTPARSWMGVPLRTRSTKIGVVAVQYYDDEKAYTARDLDLLVAVGAEMALAIERKQVEDTLWRQQKENDMIFDAAPSMIWHRDTENRIVRANRAAAQSLGMKVEDLEGRSAYDLFPSEAVQYHQDDLEVIRTGQPKLAATEPYRLPSGDVRLMRTDRVPYCDEDGKITGIVAFATDITERQRAEDAMRRSEVNYRSMVQGAPYGICRVSKEGRLFTVNPALVAMLAYESEEELMAANLDRDVFIEPGERAALVKEQGETLQGVQVIWHRKDGSPIHVRLSGVPVRDPEWPSTCYELMAENVTEQRVLENQFRQAQKLEAMGRLAGGVAHDFNNLLMVIQGHAELLRESVGNDSGSFRKVEQIENAAERAAGLTRQLLAFSRTQVLQSKVMDLNEAVAEMGKMLPRLIGEDIELKISPRSELGRIKADPGQMGQVIMNLAVNARDAMPQGGTLAIETDEVEVDEAYARHRPPLVPGSYVMLTVSDTGIGMDAETQAHIFEPFFTTKEVGKGTGLGLATVYGVVQQSGGYIWVESEKGKGTTFRVYLPRQSGGFDELPAEPIWEESPAASGTVLVAEDEKDVREIVRDFLCLSGYTVLEAPDGAHALEIARHHEGPIHLLISDVVMPHMSGHELAARIGELRPETRMIYMTGYAERLPPPNTESIEGTVTLTKPVTRAALIRAVGQALQAPYPAAGRPA
jgi:two-component system, cell cycle sensor histidine kinase and response regulator CckA